MGHGGLDCCPVPSRIVGFGSRCDLATEVRNEPPVVSPVFPCRLSAWVADALGDRRHGLRGRERVGGNTAWRVRRALELSGRHNEPVVKTRVERFFQDPAWRLPALVAAVVAGVLAVVVTGAATDLWRQALGDDAEVRSIVGGCEPFSVYSQNRWEPLGAKTRVDPYRESPDVVGGSHAPNELVVVDGWVRTRAAYPQNTSPWNSDVWFHLADNSGWVPFAAVRADPTVPDPTGGFSDDGGAPVALDEDCQGSVRTS